MLKSRILSAGVGLNKLYWSFSLGPEHAAVTRRPAVSHVAAKSHVRRMSLLLQTPRFPAALTNGSVNRIFHLFACEGHTAALTRQKRCAMPT